MPSFPCVLGFKVFIWSNEGKPLEPIHVHVTKGVPTKNSTKFWIMSNGNVCLADNSSHLSEREISRLKKALADYSDIYIRIWEEYFKEKAKYIDN